VKCTFTLKKFYRSFCEHQDSRNLLTSFSTTSLEEAVPGILGFQRETGLEILDVIHFGRYTHK